MNGVVPRNEGCSCQYEPFRYRAGSAVFHVPPPYAVVARTCSCTSISILRLRVLCGRKRVLAPSIAPIVPLPHLPPLPDEVTWLTHHAPVTVATDRRAIPHDLDRRARACTAHT